MPKNLLWAKAGGPITRATEYRAPSWSWACLDGDLVTQSPPGGSVRRLCCEILEAWTTVKGVNPFGEVRGGRLRIRGQIVESWRLLSETGGDRSVQYLYAECRVPDATEMRFKLKLGICQTDVSDAVQEAGVPVSTYFLRVNQVEGLALEFMLDGSFQRAGNFEMDENRLEWFATAELRDVDIV